MDELCSLVDKGALADLMLRMRGRNERLPLGLSADLTYRCNFGCAHCFCRLPVDSNRVKDELTLKDWDRILGECADEGALFLTFTGGEPLLRPDFRDIWMIAKKRGFITTLFTNASLIDSDLADFFSEWTPHRVSVTLYGSTEETYRRVTGCVGMHSRVMNALELVKDRGIPMEVKGSFTRLNVQEFHLIRQTALSFCDLFKWQAEIMGCYSEGGGSPKTIRLSPDEIVELESSDPVRRKEWEEIFTTEKPAEPKPDNSFRCGIGKGEFHVDAYGGLRPCMLLEKISFDLAADITIKQIWNNEIPKTLAAASYQGPCQECGLIRVCRICPPLAILFESRPNMPSPFHCSLISARINAFASDKNKWYNSSYIVKPKNDTLTGKGGIA